MAEPKSFETAWKEQLASLQALLPRFVGASLDENRLRLELSVGKVSVAVQQRARPVPTRFDRHALDLGIAVKVEGPPTELSLMLRRQDDRAERDKQAGLMLDMLTGDEAFDAAYIVEAAPKDVVRELLGIAIRDLIRAMPSEVRVGTTGPGVFVFAAASQLPAILIETIIEAGVAIAAAAPDAFARANAHASGGGPYRGGHLPDTVKAQRAQDLAAVKKVQSKRFWKEFLRSVAAMFGGDG